MHDNFKNLRFEKNYMNMKELNLHFKLYFIYIYVIIKMKFSILIYLMKNDLIVIHDSLFTVFLFDYCIFRFRYIKLMLCLNCHKIIIYIIIKPENLNIATQYNKSYIYILY